MASLGSLVADLRLNSAAFIRNMTKAQQQLASDSAKMRRSLRGLERSARNVERQFSKLRAGVGALAGAFAVRQFGQFTKAALDNADAIAKQADRIGLSTQALQEYRIVAGLAGVETSRLDQGLGAFVKRLGELRAGTGALNTLLNKSNEELKNQLVAAKTSEEALRIFLRALGETANQTDRVALSAAAFSRTAGIEMANLVRDGARSVEEMRRRMSELGLVMEENVLRASEKLVDDLGLLKTAFSTGFDTSIIQGFAGAFDATADSLRTAREIGENFGRIVSVSMRAVAAAAKFVADNIKLITAALFALAAFKATGFFLAVAASVLKFAKALVEAAKGIIALNAAVTRTLPGLIAKILAIGAAFLAAKVGLDVFDAEFQNSLKEIGKTSRLTEQAGAGVQGLGKNVRDLIEDLKRENVHLTNLAGAYRTSDRAVRDVNDAIEVHNTLVRVGIKLHTEDGQAIAALIVRNRELRREIEKAEETRRKEQQAAEEQRRIFQEPFLNAIRGIQEAFTSAFERIFSGGVKNFGDLAAEIKRIFTRLAAEIAALMVIRPVLGSIAGGIAGVGGAANAGSLSGLANIGGSGLFGSLFAGNATAIGGTTTISASGPFAGTALAGKTVFASGGATGGLASLAGPLAGAGIGALAGNIIGGFFGGKGSTGGTLGGALGGGVGTAVGGPLGGVIGGLGGSLLGGFVGSLFGNAPDPRAHSALGVSGGQFAFGDVFRNSTGRGARSRLTELIGQAESALNGLLASLGGTVTGTAGATLAIRGKTVRSIVGGAEFASKDAQAALSNFIVRTLKTASITGITESVRIAIENTAANTVEGLTADIELGKTIALLRGETTELQEAIKGVTGRFSELVDRARALGLSTAELIAQRDREIEQLKFQARSPFLDAAGGIVDFLNQQSIGAGSSLSPVGRLNEAQRQFGGLLERVRSGEIGLAGNLTQSAGALLDIGRQNFASTVNFANLEGFVRSSLLSVAETLSSESFFDAQVEATRQQTTVLAESQDRTTEAVERLEREIALLRQEIADAA